MSERRPAVTDIPLQDNLQPGEKPDASGLLLTFFGEALRQKLNQRQRSNDPAPTQQRSTAA